MAHSPDPSISGGAGSRPSSDARRARPREALLLAAAVLCFLPPPIVRPRLPTYIDTYAWQFSDPAAYTFDPARVTCESGRAHLVATEPWFDSRWRYRTTIIVNSPEDAEDLRDFPLPLVLRSPGFDFAHAATGGSDLRVTGPDGVTPLPHWVEAFDPAAGVGRMTVALPRIQAGEAQTLYLFHGDPEAPSTSDWASTFKAGPPPPVASTVTEATDHDAFPSVLRLPSGQLLADFRRGSEHLSLDGRVMLARSGDDGASWTIGGLFDEAGIDDRVNLGLTRLRDGSLILPFYQISRIDPPGARNAALPFTAESNPTIAGSFVIKSADGGVSWTSKSAVSDSSQFAWTAVYGRIMELENGILLMPAYALPRGAQRTSSILMESPDGGASWSLRSVIAAGGVRDYNEASVQPLGGSSLLAVVRSEIVPPALFLVRSEDDGLTWGTPARLCDGVSPELLRLSDGRLLLACGDRLGPGTGVRATVSQDGGASWSSPVMLAKTRGDLGYPSTVESGAGEMLTLWYDPEGLHITRFTPAYVDSNPNYDNMLDGLEQGLGAWAVVQGAELRTCDDVTHTGCASLLLTDSGTTPVIAIRQIYDYPRDDALVRFWVYPHELPNGAVFSLLDDLEPALDPLQDARFQLGIFSGGAMSYRTPACGGWISIPAAVPLGRWSQISLQLERSNVEVSLDGTVCASVRLCGPGPGVSCLGISTASDLGTGDSFFVDDIYTAQSTPLPPAAVAGPEATHYPADDPSITALSSGLRAPEALSSFAEARAAGGETRYQLSNDGGATWLWWNGAVWAPAAALWAQATPAAVVRSHAASLAASERLVFRAFLRSDGSENVELDAVSVTYATDLPPATQRADRPTPPATARAPGTAALSILPNPARGAATIGLRAPGGIYELEIYDAAGRRRWARSVRTPGAADRMAEAAGWSGSLPALPAGNYWLRARDERGGVRSVLRFVVLR